MLGRLRRTYREASDYAKVKETALGERRHNKEKHSSQLYYRHECLHCQSASLTFCLPNQRSEIANGVWLPVSVYATHTINKVRLRLPLCIF